MNRRAFLAAAATSIPAAVALQGFGAPAVAKSSFANDTEVLNYALVLEYFLSQFYREGQKILSGREADLIAAIGADEDAHIAAITQTIQNLGDKPVQAPAIDFGRSLHGRDNLLHTALKFENLFAGAYLGAAGSISNKDILQAAAGIFGAEERHAAIVANLLGLPAVGGVYVGPTEKPRTKPEVMKEVQPFLSGAHAMAGGAAVTL